MSAEKKEGMAAYAATSLFQPHHARQAIRDAHAGKIPPLLGWYAGISSIPIVRFLAPMNFDTVWIDWEHTSVNIETLTTMIHDTMFMSQGRTIPFVRLPSTDHSLVAYAMDAGASIVFPQIETVEQAKHAMAATKFGTKANGTRSQPPFRLVPGLTDTPYDPSKTIHECLNDQAAVMFQIESLKGIENLDAILTAVPEVDIVWLGTVDCRISMNMPAQFGVGSEPEWLAAKAKYFSVLKKHNKPCGGFAFGSPPFGSPEVLAEAKERLTFLTISADVASLMSMAGELKAAREICALDGQASKE